MRIKGLIATVTDLAHADRSPGGGWPEAYLAFPIYAHILYLVIALQDSSEVLFY